MAGKKEINQHERKFREEYAKLNERQKKAVDTIDRPVMVVAGPGTGKTTTLTLRIANILLKHGASPQNILALTFTESAAANMRRKLVDLTGSSGYYVNINTFHGFCNYLIQNYPRYFERIIGAENATEAKQIAILRDIIDGTSLKKLKPLANKYVYVSGIKKAITDLKNDNCGPDGLVKIIEEETARIRNTPDLYHESGKYRGLMKAKYQSELDRLDKNSELALVYEEYEKALRARNLYDFDDMIIETIKALKENKAFLAETQETYQYLLVDEQQDTNRSQNILVELISGCENPSLFLVGDEKQAIFRFQGASLENFAYFQKRFEGNGVFINLNINYRSTQNILDSAHSLIEKNRLNFSHENLLAESGKKGELVNVADFEYAESETAFVADEVEKKIKQGVPPREISVIYRENKDSEAFAGVFSRRQIPFVVQSEQNLLADRKIRKLILLMRSVEGFGDDARLAEILHLSFLNLPPLDVYRIIAAADSRRVSSLHLLLGNDEVLAKIGVSEPQKFKALYLNLKKWKKESANRNFLEFFEVLIRDSGFMANLSSDGNYLNELGKLRALFQEAKKEVGTNWDYGLRDFLRHLDVLEEHNVSIGIRGSDAADAVRLLTAHKAKGLEFDTVFIVNAIDGKWGNRRNIDKIRLPFATVADASSAEKNEDERKIFYMAITRAKRNVFITYARHSISDKGQVPSQFIEEINPELRDAISKDLRDRYDSELSKNLDGFLTGAESEPSAILPTKEEIKKLFVDRGFSMTHLNNYLSCPWKYFYSSLLRLPQTMTPSQVYGTCVHFALDDFFRRKSRGEKAGAESLTGSFEWKLKKQPLSLHDKAAILKKGGEILPKYYEKYRGEWNYNTVTEYSVSAKFTDEIRLAGRLDKLELEPDGVRVNVVDYKAKKPESDNWILGKTRNSAGDYFRQLIFYKLLLDLDPRHKYKMESGTIDFIQPDDRGKFVKRSFEVSNEQTEELKSLISEKADEILNLKFWNRTCGDPKCKFCRLRGLLNA
ncbi:MAG: ATP-dependent helicase [Patescibacteria group bacterium]|nr:ATP-dependent helicase [Patescibacteria group bacterium]